jgi:hypothetical protein
MEIHQAAETSFMPEEKKVVKPSTHKEKSLSVE